MATVTVPGSTPSAPPITYTFSSGAGLTVAQQIANALAAASSVSVTSSSTGGAIGPAPTVSGGGVNELILTTATSSTVPAGYNFVTNDVSGSSTIQAAGGSAIL